MNIYEKTYPYETQKNQGEHLVMAIEGPLPDVYAIAERWNGRFCQCGEEESSTPGHTILCYRLPERDKALIVEEFHELTTPK